MERRHRSPDRLTVQAPGGDKFVVSVEPRGTPEALQMDVTWLVGWLLAATIFNNQYKVLVRRFHPIRTKPLRAHKTTYWSIKGFRSYEQAAAAAKDFVEQIAAGKWAEG